MVKVLKRLMSYLLILCFVFPSFAAPVDAESNFEARIITEEIVLDGHLDEDDWQQAQESMPFVWLASVAKDYPPASTTFRVLADEEAVYFGITCEEPKMDLLMAEPQERDSNSIFGQDVVEIFVSPEGNGVNYYQFAVSANNDQWDGYFIEGGNTSGGYYSSIWDSAVYKGEDFWSVEVRIPLYAFAYTHYDYFSTSWVCNVARERKPEVELTTWSPLQVKFHEPERFEMIGNMPQKPSKYDLLMTNLSTNVLRVVEESNVGEILLEFSEHKAGESEYMLTLSDKAGNILVDNQNISIPAQGGTVKIDDVVIPSLGRNLFKAVLTDLQGQVVYALYYETWVILNPEMIIEMSEPFYRNNIYPDQNIKKLSGKIILNEELADGKGKHLEISLTGPEYSKKRGVGIKGKETPFNIPAKKLVVGDYILKASVMEKGKAIASTEITIRKLPESEGTMVYIDRNLNMVVNGEQIIARGWYGDEKYLVSYEMLQNSPHPNSEYVNAWHGSVEAQTERLVPSEIPEMKKDVEPSETVYAALLEAINKNRNNPEFRYYYLADEPELRNISPVYLKYAYEFLKENDPYHPVMIITRSPQKYTECADILNPHPYLNPREENGIRTLYRDPKAIREQIREVITAGQEKIAAWFTPQAFTYEFNDPYGVYPTFNEYRMSVYTAIANGAKGFTPFIYHSHFRDLDLRMGVDFIYETLARLENFLVSPEKIPVDVTGPDNNVDVLVKKDGDTLLVIAVNLSNQNTEAQISASEFNKISQMYGYRERGTVEINEGKLTLEFEPYQVHMLTSIPLGDGIKTVEDFMEELAAAKAALAKPGNILYGRGREINWEASDTYMKIRTALTNGVTDALGWRDVYSQIMPPWVEAKFKTFTPEFQRAKIYTSTIEDLEFWIWENEDWKLAGKVTGNQEPVIVLDFIENISTEKIKLVMPKTHQNTKAELYEIELYDNISEFEIKSITFIPDTANLRIGDTEDINATVYDQYNYPLQGVQLEWSSEDPSIATVDQNGNITGISEGETVVKAAYGGMYGTVNVKVSANLFKNGDFNLGSDYWSLIKDAAVWSPDEGVDQTGCLKMQGDFWSAHSTEKIKVQPGALMTLSLDAKGVNDAAVMVNYYYYDKDGNRLDYANTGLKQAVTESYATYSVNFSIADNPEIDSIVPILYNANGLKDPNTIVWYDNLVLKVQR